MLLCHVRGKKTRGWHLLTLVVCCSFVHCGGLENTESNIHEDKDGSLRIVSRSGIFLEPGFNGSVYVDGIDLMQIARNTRAMWDWHVRPKTANGKIYAIGGWNNLRNFASVDVFNGTSWSSVQPMPTARSCVGAAVFKDMIFVLGGWNGDTFDTTEDWNGFNIDTVESFNGVAWKAEPPMPSARRWLGAVVFNDRLFAIGGFRDGEHLAAVEAYDGAKWSTEAPMLTGRAYLGVAIYQKSIFVIGGTSNSQKYLALVERFGGSSWSPAPPMPTARRILAAVPFKDKIVALGGRSDHDKYLDTVEAFDGVSWSPWPPMPTERYGLAATVFENRLYAIGGSNNIHPYVDVVEVFDGAEWSLAAKLPDARNGLGLVVFPIEEL